MSCTLEWPPNTHHLLYRTSWCDRWHRDYRRSQKAEAEGGYPWLRSLPFGTFFGERGAAAAITARQVPVTRRPLLFSFRGSLGYRKPYRSELAAAFRHAEPELSALAARHAASLLPKSAPHNRSAAAWRGYLFDTVVAGDGQPYASASTLSYDEMLRSSVFTLSPPGDVWESYRMWEAVLSGSIPIVQQSETYKHCQRPAEHFLELVESAQSVRAWDQLPGLLARLSRSPGVLEALQARMVGWLRRYQRDAALELLGASRRMFGGEWRRRTRCHITPLSPSDLHASHIRLAEYWRRPQPYLDSPWQPGLFGRPHISPRFRDTSCVRSFKGAKWCHRALCVAATAARLSDAFEEVCRTPGCTGPLVARVEGVALDTSALKGASRPETPYP